MRVRNTTLLVVVVAAIVLVGGSSASAQVRLSATASPSVSQPGSYVSVVGSYYPSGTIDPAAVTVTLTPSAGGAASTTAATQVTALAGTIRQVRFVVPAIVVAAPTGYKISVAGATTGGVAFTTAVPSSITINPPASFGTITPASGQTGQTLSVTITGNYTHFSAATQVSLGAGIAVGGGSEGGFGPVSSATATSLTAQITINAAATPGARDVSVRTYGESIQKAAAFQVVQANRNPSASAGGPYNGAPGVAVTFNGSGSDLDGDTLLYAWDFGDGTNGVGASPTHSYTNAGDYTATLTVDDQHGGSAVATATVHIVRANSNPVANAGGPYNGEPNVAIAFNGSGSSDPDGDTLLYTWDFGDGSPTATGVSPSHPYSSVGDYTVSLTVDDQHGGTNAVTATVHIAPAPSNNAPPRLTITSPSAGALFGANSITVDGTVEDSDDTTVTVDVNGVAAVVTGTTFHAEGVTLREGNNLITANGTDAHSNSGTATVGVILDTTPPTVRLNAPTNNAFVTGPTITVAGIVNDTVAGTVNESEVTVAVNGVAAGVSNRSFALSEVPLVRGLNTITATARDRAGNTAQTQVVVTLTETAGQRLVVLSGNNQTGAIGAILENPLVVRLENFTGIPVPGRTIAFRVSRSDGELISQENGGQEISVETDSNGQASVQFRLGTRVGIGINEVAVTSAGVVGETIFSATSTAGPPASLKVVSGDQQRGAIGQTLAFPFVVMVLDAGGNPLANVQVTFSVEQGGGSFGGNASTSSSTDQDGKASAVLMLGEQEGINNNLVTAAIGGNVPSVSFNASGVVPGAVADTTISGLVLDNSNGPIPNATATVVGTTLRATTDAQGHFTIHDAPVGTVMLLVDGRTSTRPELFPFLNFQMTSIAGQDNTVGGPIYLPAIDRNSVQVVGGDQDVTLRMAGVEGLEFTVLAHSATFPDGSHVGSMYLSQVHSDKVPMAPPNGTAPLITGTLQPPGVVFNPPVRVQFPNTDGLPPGTVVDVYSYDHDLEQFVSQGPGRVSADGAVIVSDPGFGIMKSGWFAAPPPPPPTSCNLYCNDGNECTSDSLQDPPCRCQNSPSNNGATCGGQPDSCTDQGQCENGRCNGDPRPDGSNCDDGLFCTENDKCEGGACHGTQKEYPDAAEEDGPDFGALETIGEVVTKFLQTTGIAGNHEPTFSLAWKVKNQPACCEQKQQDVTNRTDTITATIEFELAKHTIQAPPWSGDYTVTVFGHSIGVNYGIEFGLSFSTSASLSRTKDECTDQNCWGGSISSTLTGTGALIAQVPNPALSECGDNNDEPCDLLKLSATFTTSVSVTNGINCRSIHGDATWGGLTLTPAVTLLEGTFLEYSSSIDIVLFGPVTLTSYDIPLPD